MAFFLSPYKPMPIKTKDSSIEISKTEKLWRVTTDSNLLFDNHITDICRETSRKIHALCRAASYMTFGKKQKVRMCHNRGPSNRINNLHEQVLRISYQDKNPI